MMLVRTGSPQTTSPPPPPATTTAAPATTAAPTIYSHTLSYHASSSSTACVGGPAPQTFYSTSPTIAGSTLYMDYALTTLVPDGYYSNTLVYYLVVGGLGVAGGSVSCPVPTTTAAPPPPTTTAPP